MICTLSAFLEFCYLARRSFHTEETLHDMSTYLNKFHENRIVFIETGVRKDLNPPRQHSLRHYVSLIQDFGALNGLCSLITESAHIRAVKKPWRHSSRFHALGQMLLTNQRLDKLAAARADFEERGMLRVPLIQSLEQSLFPHHLSSIDPQPLNHNIQPIPNTEDSDSEMDSSDSDAGDSEGENLRDTELQPIAAAAVLAKRPCECIYIYQFCTPQRLIRDQKKKAENIPKHCMRSATSFRPPSYQNLCLSISKTKHHLLTPHSLPQIPEIVFMFITLHLLHSMLLRILLRPTTFNANISALPHPGGGALHDMTQFLQPAIPIFLVFEDFSSAVSACCSLFSTAKKTTHVPCSSGIPLMDTAQMKTRGFGLLRLM